MTEGVGELACAACSHVATRLARGSWCHDGIQDLNPCFLSICNFLLFFCLLSEVPRHAVQGNWQAPE